MTETPTNDALDTSLDGSNLQDEEFVTEDIVNEDITEVQNPSSPVIPLLDLNNTDVFRKDKLRTPSKRAVPFSVQSPSQELYAKYIRLEQDFKDLQKAFDLVSNEKTVLEKVVKQKEVTIDKLQLDLENTQDIYDKIKEKSRLQEMELKHSKMKRKYLKNIARLPPFKNLDLPLTKKADLSYKKIRWIELLV